MHKGSQEDQSALCLLPLWLFGQTVIEIKAVPLSCGHSSAGIYVLGVPVPSGVWAHSWTLWQGASLTDLCAAATWSSQATFSHFYHLNVAASPSFGERVLGVICR